MMDDVINENLKKINTWKRIAFIVIFAIIMGVVRTLLWVIILLQIMSALITGDANQHILSFGQKLSAYIYHILLFLTFNSEEIPFPFSDWQKTEDIATKETLTLDK